MVMKNANKLGKVRWYMYSAPLLCGLGMVAVTLVLFLNHT